MPYFIEREEYAMRTYLKELRHEKGLTQAEIAKVIAMTQQNYSLIERGNRQSDMGIGLLSKLAEVFGLPLTQLIMLECKFREL